MSNSKKKKVSGGLDIYTATAIMASIGCGSLLFNKRLNIQWMSTLKVQMPELGYLLTRSRSLVVSPDLFCRLVCSILSVLSCFIPGILFICCDQFFLYSCILSKTGVIFSSFTICICFIICPSVSCHFSHIFHLCCCYSSCISCFSGPIFTTFLQSRKG